MTIVVVGALVAAILTSKGWHNVRETFFSPRSFADSFPQVLKGFWLDVRIFLIVGEVLELIRELKREGMTMLIATHEMGFARDVADEVCFLHDGTVVERGAPAEVLDAPRRPETQRFLRRLIEAGRG